VSLHQTMHSSLAILSLHRSRLSSTSLLPRLLMVTPHTLRHQCHVVHEPTVRPSARSSDFMCIPIGRDRPKYRNKSDPGHSPADLIEHQARPMWSPCHYKTLSPHFPGLIYLPLILLSRHGARIAVKVPLQDSVQQYCRNSAEVMRQKHACFLGCLSNQR